MSEISLVADNVEILFSPSEFFARTLQLVSSAKHKVSLAALYIGEGAQEDQLREAVSMKGKEGVSVHVLLDKRRSTRKHCEVLQSSSPSMAVELYDHPLQRLWSSVLPERSIEAVGTQHIKAVAVDDFVLMTGANFSTSYFTDRQDRYMVIRSQSLADVVHSVIRTPSHSIAVHETMPNQASDTTVTLAVQAGYHNIHDIDNTLIHETLHQASMHKHPVILASGYLNLPSDSEHLLSRCENVTMLTAAPEANSFFNSPGFSRYIPGMYSFFEERLLTRHPSWIIREYSRPQWTFHAKGLWVTEGGLPHTTLIGSSNLSIRSKNRDLELCFLLKTKNKQLQLELKKELDNIMLHTKPVTIQDVKPRSPRWLKTATAALFKHFL